MKNRKRNQTISQLKAAAKTPPKYDYSRWSESDLEKWVNFLENRKKTPPTEQQKRDIQAILDKYPETFSIIN